MLDKQIIAKNIDRSQFDTYLVLLGPLRLRSLLADHVWCEVSADLRRIGFQVRNSLGRQIGLSGVLQDSPLLHFGDQTGVKLDFGWLLSRRSYIFRLGGRGDTAASNHVRTTFHLLLGF